MGFVVIEIYMIVIVINYSQCSKVYDLIIFNCFRNMVNCD